MDEIMKKELKIMDDEFLKDVRKIKSVTAVHGNYKHNSNISGI